MAAARRKPGMILDGFELVERLHRGEAAELWRVSRPDIDGAIVMKLPIPGGDRSRLVELEVEQMILAEIGGPRVPRLVAQGDFAAEPHLVMSEIGGPTLHEVLTGGPLPLGEMLRLSISMADAIADLHQQNVLHLDLEPSNILFGPDGEAVLVDFGASRHAHLPDLLGETRRRPAGNLAFMAPEQSLRIRSDKRSDIFALGALMYLMATGQRPFGMPARAKEVRRRVWRDPIPPRALRAEIPPALQEVMLTCIEPVPSARYGSAETVAFELRNLDLVALTSRAARMRQAGFGATLRRRMRARATLHEIAAAAAKPAPRPPTVLVLVDLRHGLEAMRHGLIDAAANALANTPGARLACVHVIETPHTAGRSGVEKVGHDIGLGMKAELRAWAEPLHLPRGSVSYALIEARNVATGVLAFAKSNIVGHLVAGSATMDRAEADRLAARLAAQVRPGSRCAVTVVDADRRAPPA